MQISNIPPKVTPESVKLWDGIHRMEEVAEGGSEERQRVRGPERQSAFPRKA